jgi:hypothetical protein
MALVTTQIVGNCLPQTLAETAKNASSTTKNHLPGFWPVSGLSIAEYWGFRKIFHKCQYYSINYAAKSRLLTLVK